MSDILNIEGREYQKSVAGGYEAYGEGHYNQFLSNFAVGSMMGNDIFVADKALPIVPVTKMSDYYDKIEIAEFQTLENDRRGEFASPNIVDANTTQGEYKAVMYSLRSTIGALKMANADNPAMLEKKAVYKVVQGLRLGREKRFADKFLNTTNFITYSGVAASPTTDQVLKWSNDNSDPVKDFDDINLRFTLNNYGVPANAAIMTYDVFHALRTNPAVKDYLKRNNADIAPTTISVDQMRVIFGLEKLFIMSTVINKNNMGIPEVAGGKIIKSDPVFLADSKFLMYRYDINTPLESDTMGAIFQPKLLGFGGNAPMISKSIEPEFKNYYNYVGDWIYAIEQTNTKKAILLKDLI